MHWYNDQESRIDETMRSLSPTQAAARMAAYSRLGAPVWVGETHAATGYKLADYTWKVNVNDFCYADVQAPGNGLLA